MLHYEPAVTSRRGRRVDSCSPHSGFHVERPSFGAAFALLARQRKEIAIANRTSLVSELESFFDDGYITGIPRLVKSGKEATVYC